MTRLLLLTAALAAPLAAAAAPPMTAASYMMKAGAGDQYEVQSSQLLLETTQNAKLRDFANMMVTDHTKSTEDVKAAAMAANLTPPAPKLDAKGMADVAALRRAKGTARDRLYVTQQKAAHQKALMVQSGYATHGKVASLKTAAGNIVPVVKGHIAELAAM